MCFVVLVIWQLYEYQPAKPQYKILGKGAGDEDE